MNIIETKLPGVLIIEPRVFPDDRGCFMETFQHQRYHDQGIHFSFVQDNLSESKKGTLRGLHYQYPNSQGKLVHVVSGSVFDVAVDIRRGSPTFGKWVGTEISGENKRQLWVSPGFAHGFCVMSDTAIFYYKCTEYYSPQSEHTIMWNDDEIGIDWPLRDPVVSPKDSQGLMLNNMPEENLPVFNEGDV